MHSKGITETSGNKIDSFHFATTKSRQWTIYYANSQHFSPLDTILRQFTILTFCLSLALAVSYEGSHDH